MPTDEEIRLALVIETQKAIENIQMVSVRVDKLKQDLIRLSTESGKSLETTAKGMLKTFTQQQLAAVSQIGAVAEKATAMKEARKNIADYRSDLSMALSQTKEQFARMEGSAKSLTGSLGVLGNAAKFLFASVLGVTAITVVRDLVNYLKEAAVAGYDFSKSLFQLSAGINAIRRAGVDITFADMMANIKALKKEFPIFSLPELVKGSAALINLTRDFGFAKEQIFGLQDAILKLAIINGRAMDEVQRTVALAISSGYTEGLQRLGVSINRITIAEKAASLGYADSYMALTELQRAEATRLLILEKTAVYQEDLTEYQKKLPGLIDASTASFKDLTAQLGTALLPTWALVMRFLQGAADFFTRVFSETLPRVMSGFTFEFMKMVGVIKQGWEIISGKRVNFDMEAVVKQAKEAADLIKGYFSGEAFILPEPKVDRNAMKEFTDEQLDAYEKLYEELLDLRDEYGSKYEEEQKDFLADLVKLDKEYQDRQKEIWKNYYDEVAQINEDYANEVADINENYAEAIADANKKAQDRVAEINKDYGDKIRDINKDYRDQIEDIEKDYQKAILKSNEDYQKELVKINKDYAKKIADINQDTQDKIAKAEQDLAYRIEDLNRDTQNKIEDANREYHERELKAEQDYQEDLRRLREEFLFDLEDALRERDALQVLRLQRRYNLDKEERARQYELDKAGREQDFQNQLEDIRRQAAERLEELKIEHQRRLEEIRLERERELADAELNHQEDLARAAEQFQEELEQLREQYQERKAEVAEQRAEKLAEAAQQRAEDLAEAAKQRAEDLAEAAKQREEDLAEAAKQRAEDLAEAAKQRDEDLALAREEWLQKRAERTREYAQDLADLKEWFNGRLGIIIKGFVDQKGVTAEMARSVGDIIRKVFGSGGIANIAFNQFSAMIDYQVAKARARTQELLAYLAYINAYSNSIMGGQGLGGQQNPQGQYVYPGYANPNPGTNWTGGHASGATNMVLTRPKLLMAGEVPERIDITPLSQLNSNKLGGVAGNGKGTIEIRLSDGLEANIIDNTLGQFDVVLRKELGKKR